MWISVRSEARKGEKAEHNSNGERIESFHNASMDTYSIFLM